MKDNLIMVNGIIVEREEARISPFDRGFMFGDGVFEITPVYNGRPLDAEKHMENLFRNVIQLRIPVVNTVAELAELLEDFASYTELQDGEIYTQITRGAGPYELDFPEQCRPQMIMQIVPVDRQALAARRAEGVNLMTVPDERQEARRFNVLNRLDEIMAKHTASVGRCYDALFVKDDRITEATDSAFLLVKDEMLWTAPDKEVHENLTRNLIRDVLAKELDMQVIQKSFTKEFALKAEEAFLCGPRCEILPVTKLDRRAIGDGKPGAVTRKLQQALEDYIRAETTKPKTDAE
ncbi:MAG: aminotransferase class IV [Succiniclasticum sp.]|nr:aminotransferase class IV [Selenomonadales bacterium]MDY2869465.1 aminotransferase class IV [Succiniclasticum sp.]